MILSVIYAVLSRIRICRNLRVFGANSLEPNLYLCYSNRFLHLWVSPRECMGVSLLLPGECLGGDHKIEDLLESICWKA